ncbi:MAG: hypothetical protein IKP90_05205 [Fibrobacter sp.]|nr:hypothetical protein [Fibrobacter sp.]
MSFIKKILANVRQNLSEEEKSLARENIGAQQMILDSSKSTEVEGPLSFGDYVATDFGAGFSRDPETGHVSFDIAKTARRLPEIIAGKNISIERLGIIGKAQYRISAEFPERFSTGVDVSSPSQTTTLFSVKDYDFSVSSNLSSVSIRITNNSENDMSVKGFVIKDYQNMSNIERYNDIDFTVIHGETKHFSSITQYELASNNNGRMEFSLWFTDWVLRFVMRKTGTCVLDILVEPFT